jgi:U3 small nucleolar ribonucleoprotein protein IMP4
MTIVTSSRKPVPEVRSLCRDIAFSIGAECVARGKLNFDAVRASDETVLVISRADSGYRLGFLHGGETVAEYIVPSFQVSERSGSMERGLFVANRAVFEELAPYVPVSYTGEENCTIRFAGTQRRQYLLEVLG